MYFIYFLNKKHLLRVENLHSLNVIFVKNMKTLINMENTYSCSSTLKAQDLGFRGIALDINSLLGPWPWCVHVQKGSLGNHSRGFLLSYRISRRGGEELPLSSCFLQNAFKIHKYYSSFYWFTEFFIPTYEYIT